MYCAITALGPKKDGVSHRLFLLIQFGLHRCAWGLILSSLGIASPASLLYVVILLLIIHAPLHHKRAPPGNITLPSRQTNHSYSQPHVCTIQYRRQPLHTALHFNSPSQLPPCMLATSMLCCDPLPILLRSGSGIVFGRTCRVARCGLCLLTWCALLNLKRRGGEGRRES